MSFGAAISACAKAAEWQIALALLNEVSCRMLDQGGVGRKESGRHEMDSCRMLQVYKIPRL